MSEISITEKEFRQIVDLMHDRYGINLSQKKNLIVGRLQNHLHRSNFESFSEFYQYVLNDKSGEAVTLLLNKLTTNHTFFLREMEHFDYFKQTVLPHIVKTEKSKDMRIWSAGCSSGEEPYSIAMIIADFFGANKNGWDTKILATDISERVLSMAAQGKYLSENLEVLPKQWRQAYFKKVDAEYDQIIDKLRQEVIYRKFNLMEGTFPFRKKFHIIWCRNVMIYFDAQTKKALIDKFYDCTEQGGYLFIGHSESIARNDTKYKYVLPAIYRRE
jgi:chemotaxis protein methyltransferase CheR